MLESSFCSKRAKTIGILSVSFDKSSTHLCTGFVVNLCPKGRSKLAILTTANNVCVQSTNEEDGSCKVTKPLSMSLRLSDQTIELDCSSQNILIPSRFSFELNDDRNMALIGLSADQVPRGLECSLSSSRVEDSSDLKIMGLEANCKVSGYP